MTEKRIAVMHLVDTLRVGGVERVAVSLANLLPRAGYRTHLCTTRAEGPFVLVRLPPGQYRVDATFNGRTISKDVNVSSNGSARAVLSFAGE